MEIDWDAEKDRINRKKHGISLAEVKGLDWENAQRYSDLREDYGEDRDYVYARLGPRLYVCVFTLRNGMTRIISLRKANKREIVKHGKNSANPVD